MTGDARPLRVLKFGGTSVADAPRIVGVAEIVRAEVKRSRCVVVVSALGGVTAALAEAAADAARGDTAYRATLEAVVDRHASVLSALLPGPETAPVAAVLNRVSQDVRDLLHGVLLVRECSPRTLDHVLAFGELASAELVAAGLRGAGVAAQACDARKLLITDGTFGKARVASEASRSRIRAHLGEPGAVVQVVTGFIAATLAGETTTLGRGGSDYTAALIGAALEAERVEIWTDVDGVMSADPRIVPDAFSLEALSYEELLELSHFGAKVVFAPSVHPAREQGIPLLIRNTLRPAFPGTWVGSGSVMAAERLIRGITCIRQVALLRLEGDGMVGVPGVAGRLFRALARNGVSVILISQASSEHSICFAVEPAAVGLARRGIQEEFHLEVEVGLVDALIVDDDRAVVAVVGESMRDRPGIAGRLFSVLGDLGVNIHAIAQGSSELNISLVIEREDVDRAMRGLHTAFFAPPHPVVHVYLAGVGGVGNALLGQLAAAAPVIEAERGIELRLVGVASSRKCAIDPTGLPFAAAREGLDAAPANGQSLADAALGDVHGIRVLVDCTASADLPARYRELIDAGVAVVAANKRGFSGPYDAYWRVREPRPLRPRAYLETTVGAGLPILRTIEDLRASGDRLVSIEGVLSGSLSFLFNEVMAGKKFSDAVAGARERGYTEPDPREDLSGQDVTRKLVILAREAGLPMEPEAVTVEPVLPGAGWEDLDVDAFMGRLPGVDAHFAAWRDRALAAGSRLCYLASIEDGAARVRVAEVDAAHPCHGLRGSDNLVAIRTDRYPNPLVVRGAGAGYDVTAAGVLGDIMRATMDRSSGTGKPPQALLRPQVLASTTNR